MAKCIKEQTESNSVKDKEGDNQKMKNRAVDNMEKKNWFNGEICKALTTISRVALNSFPCCCLTNLLTVLYYSSSLLGLESTILGYYKCMKKHHALPDLS